MAMILVGLIFGIGALAGAAGNIWLLVKAFQTGVGWGLAVLFLPFANIVFAVKHWPRAKRPFLLWVAGNVLSSAVVVGAFALFAEHMKGLFENAITESDWSGMETKPAPASPRPQADWSDRERVDYLLAEAGIDPTNPRSFMGKTYEQMTESLGKPSAEFKFGRRAVYIFYHCFEVTMEDGRTVTSVAYIGK